MPGIYQTLPIHHVIYSVPQTCRKGVIIITFQRCVSSKVGPVIQSVTLGVSIVEQRRNVPGIGKVTRS